MEEKTYGLRKDVAGDAIEREIDAIWTALQNDPALRERATAAGIDLSAIANVKRADAIKVRRNASFAGAELLIGFAIVIATDIWKELIFPRLKEKFGADAIKEK